MKNKLKFIIPIVVAVIAIIVAALCIDFTPAEKVDIPSLVSTAQKYLIENNYEQAIAEFNKIIEIDPMNVDAYLGIVEAYVGMGDTKKAIEWLEKGYAITGDERLKNMIDKLNAENSVSEITTDIGAEVTIPATAPENEIISNEELMQVLMKLIENPNADIEQEKLDAIYQVSICGNDFYAINESFWNKYSIYSIGFVYDNNGNHVKNCYRINNDNTEYESGVISNLTFLERLNNLSKIEIVQNEICDIGSLDKMTNLTSLYLGSNNIDDISPLNRMTNLIELGLYNNQISDISPLEKMINLTNLSIWNNQISDISPLKKMTNLTSLYLSHNNINDISPLNEMTNLIELDLRNNNINDISPINGLTGLTNLWLWGNPISEADVEALERSLLNCDISFH